MSSTEYAAAEQGTFGARLPLAGHCELRAVVMGAAQVLTIRVAGAGLGYATMILLARWLGVFQFGIYAYIWVWLLVLIPALSLGYSSSALRFLPDYRARGKWRRLRGFLNQAYAISLGLSTLAACLGAGLLLAFPDFISPIYFMPLLAGFACLPFAVASNQLEGVARAFGWVHLAFLPGYIMRPLIVLLIVGALYWTGAAPTAVEALGAMIAASIAIAAVQGAIMLTRTKRMTSAIAASATPVSHTRHWATISLSFVMIDGFRMLLENSDMLMIGKLLDPESVAVYFAAARTGGLIASLYFAVVAMAGPKFSKIHTTGTREEMQRFVSGVVQLMFWPSLLAAIVIAGFGPFALSLFGVDFEQGYSVLLVVLAGLVARSAVGPVEYLLNMTGHHMDTMWATGIAAAANIALTVVLVPMMGIVGAAISSAVALAGVSIWLAIMVRRRLNIAVFVLAPMFRARRL